MDSDNVTELQPEAGDLVVVPEGTKVPEGLGFMVYSMRYLIKPSIIRSRGYGMGVLAMLKQSSLAKFFGIEDRVGATSEEQSLNETLTQAQEVKAVKLEDELPMFFRYVRFPEYIMEGEEVLEVISPRGGVTFLVELDAPNETLAFSYALCHSNDNFCKNTARNICLGRMKHGDWYEIKDVDSKIGVVDNIANALADYLYGTKPSYVKRNGASFSSVSDKKNEYELEQLLKRIS